MGASVTTDNVVALFTDLVGSTEFQSSVTPEISDEVRRNHFSVLRRAVAETGGAEVKNLGDGLMVVFATASAALSCAVAMQQGVELDNRTHEHSLGLRVGVSGGEVTKEDGDYFGEPIVEAARLCATAEGGQILAVDVVRAMAGRRSPHQCRRRGPVVLKGLPDPVETVQVLWTPLEGPAANAVPLPARLARRPTVGVFGREAELGAMTDATKRVAGGEGREVLLISGEAGQGKTTLVAEAARTAFEHGACVLFGHCEEYLATPYQLFAEALNHYVAHAPEDQLLAHVDAHGSELARLVPALAARIPDLPPSKATDSDTERFLRFGAVVGLLSQASEHQLVVLVLDDLQWADTASLELLRHLASAERPMAVLVLGTYRDTELSHAHPLLDTLAALHRQLRVSRMELSGLDDFGVASYMEAAAGRALDDAGMTLAHAVYRETDGNPLFVGEILRHLSETGAVYYDNATGRWVGIDDLEKAGLPDSVREVIGARVGRLGASAGRVLALAAVIGRDFDTAVLARAAEISEDNLLDTLDEATAADLVRETTTAPGLYHFAHALIQHTLSEDLGPTRRARAHRQIAEALDDLCGDHPGDRVGELARHWFSASEPKDVAKALDYSRQAADAALGALAPGDALRYYRQALDLYGQHPSDETLRCDLLIGLGTAQRQTGDPAHRETLLQAAAIAKALDDPHRLVTAALANNRGTASAAGQLDTERVAVLENALAALGVPDNVETALLLATLCAELSYSDQLERQRRLAIEAVEMARRLGEPLTLVRVMSLVHSVTVVSDDLDERLSDLAEAVALSRTIGDPIAEFFANFNRAFACLQVGNRAEFDIHIDACNAIADHLDQNYERWVVAYMRSTRALLTGDTGAAEEHANAALTIGAESAPEAFSVYGAQLLSIRRVQGRLAEVVDLIAQAAQDNPGLPVLRAALARILCELDRHDEARAIIHDDFADGLARFPYDIAWLPTMTNLSYVSIRLAEHDTARILYRRMLARHAQVASVGSAIDGPVALYLGALSTFFGAWEEADGHFAEALDVSRSLRAPYWTGCTQVEWARMLLQRARSDDVRTARTMLMGVRDTARHHGFAALETQVTTILLSDDR